MAFPKTLKPETVARMNADLARHSAERFQTACDLVMGPGDPNIWASSVLGFMRRAGVNWPANRDLSTGPDGPREKLC
jgi:hypothetical protein